MIAAKVFKQVGLATVFLPSLALAQVPHVAAAHRAGAQAAPETALEAASQWPRPSPELLTPLHPPREQATSMHPPVVLRDSLGASVIESSRPVSAMVTCGECHDTSYIEKHGDHFQLGFDVRSDRGTAQSGRPWDVGFGFAGRFSPLAYGPLWPGRPAVSADAVDAWAQAQASFLLGGGPLAFGNRSRAFEPNCFYCHVEGADFAAAALMARVGKFEWIATATLRALSLYNGEPGEHVKWDSSQFMGNSAVLPRVLRIRAPRADVCGNCHGVTSIEGPSYKDVGQWPSMTELTGQAFSPSRVKDSELNLAGRDHMSRPWDVHAERLLTCTDCHYSPNDPAAQSLWRSQLGHMSREVRANSIGEFLRRPDHRFASGTHGRRRAQGNAASATVECRTCHTAQRGHEWLPKPEVHLSQLACESCHIPVILAPARSVTDFTLPTANGQPRTEYRGVSSGRVTPASYIEGTSPLLLRRDEAGKASKFAPYNLSASWFWVANDGKGLAPVPKELLVRAFFDAGKHRPDLIRAMDRNGDGSLADDELLLDTQEKVRTAQSLLSAQGARNAQIVGELQAIALNHGVAQARDAERDCQHCHSENSRLGQPFVISLRSPFGAMPQLRSDSGVSMPGEFIREASGHLVYRAVLSRDGAYILGKSRLVWIDTLGKLTVGLTLLAALGHGLLRYLSSRKRRKGSQ